MSWGWHCGRCGRNLPGGRRCTHCHPHHVNEAIAAPTAAELLAWCKARPGCSWKATVKDIEEAIERMRAEKAPDAQKGGQ